MRSRSPCGSAVEAEAAGTAGPSLDPAAGAARPAGPITVTFDQAGVELGYSTFAARNLTFRRLELGA
jgi:hypothetical protein